MVKVLKGDKVHGGYEDDMVSYHSSAIMGGLEAEIKAQHAKAAEKIRPITNGLEAAKAIIELIKSTQHTLAPDDIIDKWVEVQSIRGKEPRSNAMWAEFGDKTIEVMARGCRVLAAIWQGAWKAGSGDKNIGNGSALTEADMEKLYNSDKFLPSQSLDKY